MTNDYSLEFLFKPETLSNNRYSEVTGEIERGNEIELITAEEITEVIRRLKLGKALEWNKLTLETVKYILERKTVELRDIKNEPVKKIGNKIAT